MDGLDKPCLLPNGARCRFPYLLPIVPRRAGGRRQATFLGIAYFPFCGRYLYCFNGVGAGSDVPRWLRSAQRVAGLPLYVAFFLVCHFISVSGIAHLVKDARRFTASYRITILHRT
jgi:hypothetical protein